MHRSTNNYTSIILELRLEAFECFLAEIEKPPQIVPVIAKLLTHKAPWDNLPTEESQTP